MEHTEMSRPRGKSFRLYRELSAQLEFGMSCCIAGVMDINAFKKDFKTKTNKDVTLIKQGDNMYLIQLANKLVKYNINNHMYIQITENGWEHLKNTVGVEYIEHCIQSTSYKKEIDGEIWYRLQCHEVFSLFPINSKIFFNTNVMFDSTELEIQGE